MPYRVKRGVVLLQTTATEKICGILEIACERAGLPFFIITSGAEGAHRPNSLHYEGKALDIRNRDWPDRAREAVYVSLGLSRKESGDKFRFLPETDHLHVEWRG